HFLLIQVILGDTNIAFANRPVGGVSPGGQAHIRFVGAGALHHHLSRRVMVNRVMKLVLHRGEEFARDRHIQVVVDAGRVNVGTFCQNIRSLARIARTLSSNSSKYRLRSPPSTSRWSSRVNSLTRYSRDRWVAQMRNCVPQWLFTR